MMYTNTLLRKVRSYAPLTCYLNEFIEREINFSLVQQMRHKYGIEMPEFFARFKPRCWVTVRTPEQEIKLNACKYPDRWAPVMLGQAMCI